MLEFCYQISLLETLPGGEQIPIFYIRHRLPGRRICILWTPIIPDKGLEMLVFDPLKLEPFSCA